MPEDENEVLDNNENEDNDNTNENNEEEDTMPDTTMGKLQRSALVHYVNTAFATTLTSPDWYRIGKNVEDMSVELNPDVEATKNILDETAVEDKGYAPSVDVETYYADPSDGDIYTELKDIAMNRKTGDDCKTLILEVLIDKTTGPYDAWVEEVILKPKSYGGATGGVRIPYTMTFCGNRKVGTVTIANKVPTFTETT